MILSNWCSRKLNSTTESSLWILFYCFNFILQRAKRKFENFYWYDVICPTDKITIDVRIPKEYCTEKVKLKSFLDHEGSVGSKEDIINYNGAYKWEISTPKLGWSYKFEWNWSKKELTLKSKRK